jgi:hypothetical protein
MDKQHWKHIARILDLVLNIQSKQERDIVIENECGDNPILKKDVNDFYRSVIDSDSFWEDLSRSRNVLTADMVKKHAKDARNSNDN